MPHSLKRRINFISCKLVYTIDLRFYYMHWKINDDVVV